ncbi:helix-turn-helix transcriptional regulator [Trinickia violacea]|uniref:helix-turn-helix transcriptional regulator n=1 Tax=Trinickia violacea TaxID=2571746 RepID=UPI0020C7E9D0|nr:WYL domain-containing protein [Trinickia violacea]
MELLRRIPRNRKVSATELHDQLTNAGLARDLRTIQRQLEMLSEHFDIERDDRSKPYGYRWKERACGLSMPGISEQESLLLTLAEQHLHNLLPASLMKSMAGFFEQARMNLGPHANAKRERTWLSKVRVVSTTQPLLPPRIKPGVFEAVSNALYADRWLKVEYVNAAGKRSAADLMPLGLAQQGSRLYLVGRYEGYGDERILALNRIVSAQASTRTFERPADFDLQQYDADGRFGFGEGKQIRLSFRIHKEAGLHLLESPLSLDQQVKEVGNQLEIRATVVDTAQLEWWLRGFGDQVSKVRRVAVRASRAQRPTDDVRAADPPAALAGRKADH